MAHQPDDKTRTLPAGVTPFAEESKAEAPKAPAPSSVEFERGTTVGRFVVLERVGAGGMATVYAAWDPQLSRRVALKVLRADSDTTERLRTLREARALAQLSHPNVVRLFDLGEVNGVPFIAMELVEGSSLREVLKNPLSKARLFELFEQAGRGLAAVHGLGIVHRDFKPANVLVGHDGRVCIGDFGLAIASRGRDDEGELTPSSGPTSSAGAVLEGELTQKGLAPGTPRYMSPEQMRGEPLDARADQFAFAVALWHAIFGEHPYGHDGLGALRQVTPSVPRRRSFEGRLVEPVLRRALDCDRERRYPDVPALLLALARARRRPTRVGALVAGLLTLGLMSVVVAPRALSTDPCGVRALASAAVPEDVRARLRASGGANPLADIGAHVDAWISQWTNAAESACRRDDLPDRAAVRACLDRRLGDLTALTTVLTSRGDPVETALPAVLALPSPSSCLSAKELRSDTEDKETQRKLERGLAEARAAYLSGRARDALERAREVVAASRATQNERREAEALRVMGLGAMASGDFGQAELSLRESIAGAMRIRDERLEAEAWIDLANVVGDRARRIDEAMRLLPIIRAAAARLPDDIEIQVHERHVEALIVGGSGDLQATRPKLQEAIKLAETRIPRDPLVIFRVHNIYGNILSSLGEVDEGVQELETARRALQGALPAGHPSFGAVSNNLGLLYQRKGDPAAARMAFEEALRLFERIPQNPNVAIPLENLATLSREQGNLEEARDLFLRARQRFVDTYGAGHERTLVVDLGLALVEQAEGRFEPAGRHMDDVVVGLSAQNSSSIFALGAMHARAALAFEAGASAAEQTRLMDALRTRLAATQSQDVLGVRAEFALLEAAVAWSRNDVQAARSGLDGARENARHVRWYGFSQLVAAWAAVVDGQRPVCANRPMHVALSRVLKRRCAEATSSEVPSVSGTTGRFPPSKPRIALPDGGDGSTSAAGSSPAIR